MRTLVSVCCIAVSLTAPLTAQTEKDAVMAVITRLFDGMRAGDSAVARSAFMDDAQLYRAQSDTLTGNSVDGLIRAIGTPHDSVWDEVLWDEEVRIDGPLATVWTKYAFFIGSRFSHCGVDAFQLYRSSEGWKIFFLADTQRRQGCDMPPSRR